MEALKACFLGALLLGPSMALADTRGLHVVVTPLWEELACGFQAENDPPVVRHELVRFRVFVHGGTRLRWRLPLYRSHNGVNEMRVARIGAVTLEDRRSFTIDVAVADLEKASGAEALELELTAPDGKTATCATPVPRLREPARSPRTPQLAMPGVVGLPRGRTRAIE